MANETKHTPGPWTPAKETAHTRAQVFEGGDYARQIADVFGESYETRAANARLIAAAPEMLACLKAWIEAERDAHFEEQAHDPEGCRYCESLAVIAEVENWDKR